MENKNSFTFKTNGWKNNNRFYTSILTWEKKIKERNIPTKRK